MTADPNSARTRLRHYGPRGNGQVRLLCFPYAGGYASTFRDWHTLLPADVEPVAIELPGRDPGLAEPPYARMEPLVADLVGALTPILDRPFACWGFSMGARVALALTYALRDAGLPMPVRLFVAGSAAPALRLPVRGWDEPNERLVGYLRDLGGTPPAVLDDPELLGLVLPTVRADLTVVGTCPVPAGPPLQVPIRAFAGACDTESSPTRMLAWERETSAGFGLEVVDGGHFLSAAGLRQALARTAADLLARP
jgi:surfactin synthase thioesterase subunit